MADLLILKHMHSLSDEALCARWIENPYYQYFCGATIKATRASSRLSRHNQITNNQAHGPRLAKNRVSAQSAMIVHLKTPQGWKPVPFLGGSKFLLNTTSGGRLRYIFLRATGPE